MSGSFEFDISDDTPVGSGGQRQVQRPQKPAATRRTGLVGLIATLGALLLKLGSLLKFAWLAKLLLTLGSFFGTIWLEAQILGWPWAVGIVFMIFVHECGHAFAARRFGLKFEGMLFIPFMGGIVFHRKGNTTIAQDAYVGIMGPVYGALYSLICFGIFWFQGGLFWLSLAKACFVINFMNLILPVAPFDGHWLAAVFSKRAPTTSQERLKYGFAWAGLALLLILGAILCNLIGRIIQG